MSWSPKENDAFFGEPQEEEKDPPHPRACIEARAAELHEGCRMPMEQARELAASEASPDWYARGQDWGLADALTTGQNGDWVLDDIARAFAAGAQAGAAVERTHSAAVVDKCNSYIVDNARLAEQVENLRAALQWYADGLHFDKASPDAWDTVSGALGALVGLRFAPGASWFGRAFNVTGGGACAWVLTPALAEMGHVSSAGMASALAFAVGMFGLSAASAISEGLRALKVGEIITGWLSRRS